MRISIKAFCMGLCTLGLAGCLAAPDRDTETTGNPINVGEMDDDAGPLPGNTGGDASANSGATGNTNMGTGGTAGDAGMVTPDAGKPSTDAGPMVMSADVPTGAHCAAVAAWDPKWAQFEQDVLKLTNEARAKGHNCDTEGNFGAAPPLTMEPRLRCSARLHSQYMATVGDDFAHTQRETGLDPFERMTAAGYQFTAASENIAVGQSTPKEVVDGWLESDGHCANMMSKDVTQLGVGYDVGPYDSGFGQPRDAPYWTQNFGRPR